MRANRPRDTGPERAIRSELFTRGLRYRVHRRPVAGLRCEVDVVFPTERVAVFVDGCFWHSCPQHGLLPKSNREWWRHKLDANVERDLRTQERLEADGWAVIRVWEHEPAVLAADRIETLVRHRRVSKRSEATLRTSP